MASLFPKGMAEATRDLWTAVAAMWTVMPSVGAVALHVLKIVLYNI